MNLPVGLMGKKSVITKPRYKGVAVWGLMTDSYYQKRLQKSHSKILETAITHNQSSCMMAVLTAAAESVTMLVI